MTPVKAALYLRSSKDRADISKTAALKTLERIRMALAAHDSRWRALVHELIWRTAPAAPSVPAGLTEDDMHALMGHAVILHGQGQTDMPAYLFDLAARIAPDKAHADRARELWAKLRAASAAATPTDGGQR